MCYEKVMATLDQHRIRSVLTESITLLCKSVLSDRTNFSVEGLLGITIDSREILLVSINETVHSNSEPSSTHVQIEDRTMAPTILLVTAPSSGPVVSSAIDTTPMLSDEFSQAVTLLLKDTGIVEDGMTDSRTVADIVSKSNAEKDEGGSLTLSNENSFTEFDSVPRSSLFTSAELDEFIVSVGQCPTVENTETSNDGFVATSKAEMQTVVTDTVESNSCSSIIVGAADVSDSLLLPGDAEDQIGGCLTWDDDDLSDIGPLNLAGPEDLSTGLGKKRIVCAVCGQQFSSEDLLVKHDCKGRADGGLFTTVPPEQPLNLISRPLDLTIGVRDDDDSTADVYEMLMSATAVATASGVVGPNTQQLACICSKTFDTAETFATHIAACAKSRLTPYRSCETCGKVLFSNSGYVKHRRLHAGAYKYRCSICRQGFFDMTNLRAHADSKHSKVRRYACVKCDKSFFWKHHLKRHLDMCGTAGTVSPPVPAVVAPVTIASASEPCNSSVLDMPIKLVVTDLCLQQVSRSCAP